MYVLNRQTNRKSYKVAKTVERKKKKKKTRASWAYGRIKKEDGPFYVHVLGFGKGKPFGV